MSSPLFPTFDKRIADATNRIIQDQVTPWAFLKAGPKFSVKRFDGREISYEIASYEGSPKDVFWSNYIEPFLEAMAVEEISHAVSLAAERKIDLDILLPEIEGLLLSANHKVFDRMADIDRRLRGDGFPEKIPLRSTVPEFNKMQTFISDRVRAELRMWKRKPRLQKWYEENTFATWLIGIFITVIGLIITVVKILTSM